MEAIFIFKNGDNLRCFKEKKETGRERSVGHTRRDGRPSTFQMRQGGWYQPLKGGWKEE